MNDSKENFKEKIRQTSIVRVFLIMENASIFIFTILSFIYINGNWILFLLLILAPDLFMLGYLKNPRIGSLIYNVGHIYIWPIILSLIGLVLNIPLILQIGIIWLGHISLDRMMGYGLKYPTNFKDTHLKHL